MEFVKPSLIINDLGLSVTEEKLLSYKELKSISPVKVSGVLELLNEGKSLYQEYVNDKLKLIPVVRFDDVYKPKSNFPTRVLLEMTSKCNLNCSMCPRQKLTREKVHMDPVLFKKCVDELDNVGINGLWIYNIGESILHPQFYELLKYVSGKSNLGPIWLSSNGQELTENFSDMIVDSKITFMNLSVNATTAETYSKVSPDADWNVMIKNFAKFSSLKKLSGKRLPFARFQIIDQECAKGEIEDFLHKYADCADILAINLLEGFSKDVESNIGYAGNRERQIKKNCRRVNRQDMFIFSNGETTFCDTDFNGIFSMGNVKDNSILQVWNSEFRGNIVKLNGEGRLNEISLCENCLDFDL